MRCRSTRGGGPARCALCVFPVSPQGKFGQEGKHYQEKHDVQENAWTHRNDMKFGEYDIGGRKQEQRAGDVAMHSPTSGGVRQTRDAHNQESWNPKPWPHFCP